MSDSRYDDAGDDFDLEVSRLDEAVSAPASPDAEAPALSAEDTDPGVSSLATQGKGRGMSRQRRLLRASMTASIVALAVALILASFPNSAYQVTAPLRLLTPEPTPTVPLGSDIILLAHTVPWGILRVDGRTDRATDLGVANGYRAYRLPPGQHVLDYVAPLFPTVHCVVSAPARASDTCRPPRNPGAPVGQALRTLDMNATVSMMDLAERSKLWVLLTNGVSFPPILVKPGMRYLDQLGNVTVAREQMTATMAVGAVPQANDDVRNDDGQPCGDFCASSQQDDPAAWSLLVNMKQRWTYVPPGGGSSTALQTGDGTVTPAQVTWSNNEWTLSSKEYLLDSSCMFWRQVERFYGIALENGLDFNATYSDAAANGCVTEYAATDSDNPRKAQILYRLGVTLAVNAEAQRIFPELLLANADERAIAQSIRAGAVQ